MHTIMEISLSDNTVEDIPSQQAHKLYPTLSEEWGEPDAYMCITHKRRAWWSMEFSEHQMMKQTQWVKKSTFFSLSIEHFVRLWVMSQQYDKSRMCTRQQNATCNVGFILHENHVYLVDVLISIANANIFIHNLLFQWSIMIAEKIKVLSVMAHNLLENTSS